MTEFKFTVPSDYGCLAIVAPDSYHGFIGEHWELEQLMDHIIQQNNDGNIVPWGCGYGNWIVRIILMKKEIKGEREFQSQIKTSGKLLLTTYDTLTMAAQFKDETLPQDHEHDQIFQLQEGEYQVKVIQHFKTSEQDSEEVFNQTEPHFTVLLFREKTTIQPLKEIPWFSA